MPNPIYGEFTQALSGIQQRQANKQVMTMRDLEIDKAQRAMQPGSVESLTRQLQARQLGEQLERFPQTAKAERLAAETAKFEQLDDLAQSMLDAGKTGHDVVERFMDEGVLPEGTKAKKIDSPWGGEKVWSFYNPDVPGYEEPQVFNEDVIKARRQMATTKDIGKFKADMKLLLDGYEWEGDSLRAIPGGPADASGKGLDWGLMKGAPMIMKLHAYRQQLVDDGAPPKMIQEVEDQINDPDTASKIFGGMMAKVAAGVKLNEDELTALDMYKQYGNPMAQMLSEAISDNKDSLRSRLAAGGKDQRGGAAAGNAEILSFDSWEEANKNTKIGEAFVGPDGNEYIRKE